MVLDSISATNQKVPGWNLAFATNSVGGLRQAAAPKLHYGDSHSCLPYKVVVRKLQENNVYAVLRTLESAV